MGFILNIIASILIWIMHPFCYVLGAIESLINREFSDWEKEKAIAKDKFGNVLIKYPANRLLIKKGGYRFGNHKETISKVLGINKREKTLSLLGKLIANILNKLDKNHVEDATRKTNIRTSIRDNWTSSIS
jgi:8-oxo-dGTP diphosphatase